MQETALEDCAKALEFQLSVISAVSPFPPLIYTKTSNCHPDAHVLKGQTVSKMVTNGIVRFEGLCFTVGTADFPNGKVHLLVTCSDPRVAPFLVASISVRTKRVAVRQVVTRKEKEASLFCV